MAVPLPGAAGGNRVKTLGGERIQGRPRRPENASGAPEPSRFGQPVAPRNARKKGVRFYLLTAIRRVTGPSGPTRRRK